MPIKEQPPFPLKAWRTKYGLSQRELARKAGIDKVTVWLLENRDQTPNRNTLERLADAFGVTIFELYGSPNP